MAGPKDSASIDGKASPAEHYDAKPQAPTSAAERQERMAAALAIDPGHKTWSWRGIQSILITLCVCCCSGDSGFDGTVMGGINTMNQYQQYFGMSGAGAKTGIVFGIFTVGALVGAIPASYLPDRFGRRASMFFGNAILVIGAVVTATATHRATFIGGRFLTGLGVGCAGASAKSYLVEIVPPQTRGFWLGVLNSFYYVGQMTATGMMVATGRWTGNELSWRLPLYIQAVPAGINVIFVFLCPESPRWLYANGQKDKARSILAKLHSATNDPYSPVVEIEMEEIEEKTSLDGTDKRFWDFRGLFRSATDRYRTYMVIMIGAFGQLSGNGLITYFLPVLLEQAGITSQNRRLTLNFVNSVTSMTGALTGSILIDRLGRRTLLLGSTTTLVFMLAIIIGLLSSNGNSTQANAGISFIYLFMVVFSFGWTPTQALYPAEVLSYQSRAKGLAFLNVVTQASSCINTFGLPVALEKLGWKTYLIFLVWDSFEVVMIYLFVVETKGLTLEQIDEIFSEPNPRKYSIEHAATLKASKQETAA
ncbi:Lactose permease OS=Kluyveromyces lactis (strain ATCC 8585 / CBS 2359 / DSM 70799 / NBRC 1267 / NRRL Y-1140 / WM37) GN=LAC12 PE=3 SV=1 [Rhizoctonia solani AG-1 IB]|uniref:Lactose permease n=2 Tax=Thanatephorus cucumeris (strain AG1-IB / isolate 7/3/14) TaxID=1108050 RepID=A0A0B7FX15_THACB|nr:Lactose permease OS=Kluyveromyces lactis (strain ATCC 8585 / CBS 2359 / DSM 70799 / NBRC 1267 / NRRL Y-1140 / WM37) GN=LAC12 PE=3 SV=1 [Rhizoctonia solani AG-1 IB]